MLVRSGLIRKIRRIRGPSPRPRVIVPPFGAMTIRHTDAVVIGGGLVGCLVARELANEGHRVTIVERAKVGREASHEAAGMLAPIAEAGESRTFLDLCIESRDLHAGLANELFAEVGVDVWYRNDGTFLLAFDDAEADALRERAAEHAALGLESELVAAGAARREEPGLSPSVTAVLSVPGDHQVDNRKLVEAAALSCYARGVKIVEHTPVRALVRDSANRITGVDTTAGVIEAGCVIVAAGSWSSLIGGFDVPVEPVKGQILMLELASPPCRRVLRSERCYVVARIDGRVLVGGTMERVGFDKSVVASAVGNLLEAGREVVPTLGSAFGGEAWAGLRPSTPDGLPAIGRIDENLVAATGHFRNGILLAPVTAKIVGGLLRGDAPHKAAGLLNPLRFSPSDHAA